MTISSLSQVQPQNLFMTLNNNGTGSGSSSAVAASLQDPDPQLSPAGTFLSNLQQLQQQNPAQFKQVTQNIATQMEQAAQQATQQGNTTQAAALTKLASDFQNASQTGQMPSADTLQADFSALHQAGGGHGHHGHHHHGSSSASPQNLDSLFTSNNPTNSQDLLNSMLSSSM